MEPSENERKGKVLAWITYILNLVVGIPVFAVVSLCIVEIIGAVLVPKTNISNGLFIPLALLLAICFIYLWGRYQYRVIVQKVSCSKAERGNASPPKGKASRPLLLLLLLLGSILTVPLVFLGIMDWLYRNPHKIQARDYAELTANHRSARHLAESLIPERATNIDFVYRPSFRGGYAYLKCSCTQEALRAFEAKQGITFIENDDRTNANPDGPKEAGGIEMAWRYYYPDNNTRPDYPKNYLAYNYVFRNYGGRRFLYDIDQQVLYACWSSN